MISDTLLQRLVTAYENGRLVPFLGAGMSAPYCLGWGRMIEKLEAEAGITPDPPVTGGSDELIRRANRAVRALRNQINVNFPETLRRALADRAQADAGADIPRQTRALARMWWPLVLTTNYDDCYYWSAVDAHKQSGAPTDSLNRPLVLGRSRLSSQRLLHSLGTPHPPVLWALQGFLGGQHSIGKRALERKEAPWSVELYDELVVGHEEYRRVTHNSAHFRRAFAEVFRTRTLWFLGSGLSEAYFQDLFGEILEMYGPNPAPHYAFVERGKVDPQFLSSRFNILVEEYDSDGGKDHSAVPEWIEALDGALKSQRPRTVRWGVSLRCPEVPGTADEQPGLEVVRSKLPRLREGISVAVSAGETRADPWFSPNIHGWLKANVSGFERTGLIPADGQYVLRTPERPVYVVVARAEHLGPDTRDARAVFEATQELLSCAAADGQTVVHAQLLSAGKTRTFPAVTSLIQMVRGYAAWNRRTDVAEAERPRLVIHVVDPGVLFALSTGRVDLKELLTCTDVRFWMEGVRLDGSIDRQPMLRGADTPVRSLLAELDIPTQGWQLDVHPQPHAGWKPRGCDDLMTSAGEEVTLGHLGVVPGSTLQFVQLPAEAPDSTQPPAPGVRRRRAPRKAGPAAGA